jgi:hypothetical protein
LWLLIVFAVILSEAKDRDTSPAANTVRPFLPQILIRKSSQMAEGHVYILGSITGTLYTGVTSRFDQPLEHRNGIKSTFTSAHRCNRLLFYTNGLLYQ